MTTSDSSPLDDTYYPGIDLLPGCPSILTPKDVAFICGVSPQTIHRMVKSGDFTTNDDGDILKSDLIKYIKTHTLADKKLL